MTRMRGAVTFSSAANKIKMSRQTFATPKEVMLLNISGPTRKQYEQLNMQYVKFLIQKGLTENAFITDAEGNVEAMNPNTLKLPIVSDHFLEFLHDVSKLKDMSTPEAPVLTTPHNTMTKYRSAMKKLYTEREHQFCPDLESKVSIYLKVIEVLIAKEKKKGLRPYHDGKSKLSFSLFVRICQQLCISNIQEGDLVRAFFTTCWNMMARSDTTSSIMLNHLSWDNDHMKIIVPQHKGDQAGNSGELAMTKHVYANPHMPAICSLLSLAIYIVT